jgi:sugar transferase (PEP-CTERM/EpsH1 system associated)
MRIMFLAHRLPYPPDKGDKIRSSWELRSLAEKHQVDLFCFYDQPGDKKHIETIAMYCDRCCVEKIRWLGSRLRSLAALFGGRPFSTSYFYSDRMTQHVREALRSRQYDVILVFSSSMAQYAEGLQHIPRILDMVDVDSDKWAQYARSSKGPVSWLWKAEARRLAEYERRIVKEFTTTLLCTEREAAILKKTAGNQGIDVLPNVIDLAYFNPDTVLVPDEIATWKPYVVFTGAMDYRPNVDAALYFVRDIFPFIRKELPELRFVIAGSNPVRAIRRLATDDTVRVTGTVTDIRPYLRGAVAAVLPMRISRGIQNKILEALAMGLPVITSSGAAAALPSSVASLLMVENEPRQFVTRVVDAVSNGPNVPLHYVRSQLLQHFGAGKVRRQFEQVLSNAVSRQELQAWG